jgi:lipid II:glycine glycyltransferase (peptidoglycan interpeptide bridge formation enzyme)
MRWRFSPSPPRNYTHTIWFELSASENDLLHSFHRSARRNIRIPFKKGLAVLPIKEFAHLPRVKEIFKNTFHRTGGTPPEVDWEVLIRTNDRPGCDHRMVGLFSSTDLARAKLLAFAVAFLHGDVAEFAHAGSARDPGFRIPLLYAPTWELMLWAKSKGVRFWDFGGIVPVASDSGHPLTGINDFKRYFSQQVVEVGEEWVLQAKPLVSTLRRIKARSR